jgi:acyl-CoA dehydrogenase
MSATMEAPSRPQPDWHSDMAGSLAARAHAIGRTALAPHADAVDREARFPAEAIAALRADGLLGALVPTSLGGAGADIAAIVGVCHVLGQYCAASAMIYAMHQIQLACLVHHGQGSPWHRRMCERVAAEQLLLGSATTEGATGGDVSRSACALVWGGELFQVEKHGAVISYGDYADAIMITARRNPEAAAGDQSLAVLLREDFALEQTAGWDALGMRGTCSLTYRLAGAGSSKQVLAPSYAEISARTMLPVSHLVWAALWTGIATDAVGRAQACVRAQARQRPGTTPPGAVRLSEAVTRLQQATAAVAIAARNYQASLADPEGPQGFSLAIEMNSLKTGVSMASAEVVHQALLICGLAGYRSTGPSSVARHLRDVHSAALMVNNDRISANSAQMLLMQKIRTELPR